MTRSGYKQLCGICTALLAFAGCRQAPQPPAAAPEPPTTRPVGLTDVTGDWGLSFTHDAGASGSLYLPEIMGAGVALFDYDSDGDLDLYAVNGGGDPLAPAPDAAVGNRLFRQTEPGVFEDVSIASGLSDKSYGMGAAVGDIDNDGHPDVYVTNLGRDRLYRNRGDGRFEDMTEQAGIGLANWSSSAAFCDIDRDGDLDLFVAQYVRHDPAKACSDDAGEPVYCGPKVFQPLSDVLLENQGNGTFRDISRAAGISTLAAAGLGVVCGDLDGDGWDDIAVANDAYNNHVWINQRDRTFSEQALVLGAAYNAMGQAEAGMGILLSDLDGDALDDLFLTHLGRETNTLYRRLPGTAGFADVTGASGLAASSMTFTGFGTAALDVELDGDLDIVIANGRVKRSLPLFVNAPRPWHLYAEPNLFYLNDGKGRFVPAGSITAALTEPAEISRGLAVGDLDNDGDQDIVLSNCNGPLRVYRNDLPRAGHWLSLAVSDPAQGRPAIGARVTVHTATGRFARTVRRAFSYLSSSDARVHVGLGPVQTFERVTVRWPDGTIESFGGGAADRHVEIIRGRGELQS